MPRRGASGMAGRRKDGADGTVVISTRVRLARNFAHAKFPQWASVKERERVFQAAGASIEYAAHDLGMKATTLRVSDSSDIARKFYENRLVSRDLLDAGDGAGFSVATPRRRAFGNPLLDSIVVMVNEEDHFRIQAFRQGYDLDGAWKAADEFDTALSRHAEYAFSRQMGYLTACPSNIGTGLRASVMVTLPGLLVCDETEAVFRAVERLGYNVRGMYGEGTKSSAPPFIAQISNRGTLGLDEKGVISALGKVVDEVVRVEIQARRYAMRHDSLYLADEISRNLGLVKSALMLGYDEFVSALHMIRFGAEIGLVTGCSPESIDEALVVAGDCAVRSLDFGRRGKSVASLSDSNDYPDVLRSILAQSLFEDAALAKGVRQ